MPCCDCKVEVEDGKQRTILWTLLSINGVMFIAEFISGILADSTGLVADSLDMLADAIVYGIALYAVGRAASIKIRAARWSGCFQVTLACGVMLDIVRRLLFGSAPDSLPMLIVSGIALVANILCLRLIHSQRKGEVHMRASWIFSKNDVIANLGVILAGLLVYLTNTRWPDILIGAAITILVLQGGINILKDANAESRKNAICA